MTNHFPFDGDSEEEVMKKIQDGIYKKEDLFVFYDEKLGNLVIEMMNLDYKERPKIDKVIEVLNSIPSKKEPAKFTIKNERPIGKKQN